ncbi:MAG: NAD-dependent epimerase/dehydratase family protein [bacterium]|nr:NAD-dependent epimerase/dehydratase family protein [bacterium]
MIVTGANGFLGSYVVAALLQKGHPVIGLKREQSSTSEFNLIVKNELGDNHAHLIANFKWKIADILDITVLDEVFEPNSIVFHCAAKVAFNMQEADEMMAINVEGTANVVNACLKNNVKQLVHVSSTAALGRTDNATLIDETTEWEDNDHNTQYAISKHLAELEVWRGIEEGLNAVIVNPGIILGYGDWHKGSCRLFRNIDRCMRFYTNGINGFVDVHDVANAMCYLADNAIVGQRFLLVSENLSYRTVLNEIAESIHKPAPNIELKVRYKNLFLILVRLNLLFNPKSTLTPETVRTSLKKHQYSNAAILKVLNFKFNAIADTIHLAGIQFQKENI